MFTIIQDLIVRSDSPAYWNWIAFFITLLLISLICIIGRAILNYVLKTTLKILKKKKSYLWVEDFLRHKLPEKTGNLIIPIILYNTLDRTPYLHRLLDIIVICIIVTISILLINAVSAMTNDIYNRYDISKTRPIKGVLQVAQIIIYVVIAIIAVSAVMGKNPVVLLGGIGAAAAVVSFIFKDPILGFVAGVQLINNDMLRIGDWITMEQYNADGIVQEISMTTVKIENFDKSLTSVPAQVMVNDAFINWRHMEESQSRRIKRSLYIDLESIKECDEQLITKIGKLNLLEKYINENSNENSHENTHDGSVHENIQDKNRYENNKHTNIGCFRAYIFEYIKGRPDIRDDMTIIVRQLDTDGKGMPIEIYAFVNTTEWHTFENIQSDIFDHLYSKIPEFELKVYQKIITNQTTS